MKQGSQTAATLIWPVGHTPWTDNGAYNEVYVKLEKNAAGFGLLSGYEPGANKPTLAAPIKNVPVDVWATLNPFNYWPVTSYNLNFVKPLSLEGAKVNDSFTDGVIGGSRIDMSKAFTLTDCFGYAVAKETKPGATGKESFATDLYGYYEVQQPVYDLKGIKFGMKVVNGNVVVDPTITTADGALTADQLKQATNGSVIPSIKLESPNTLVYESNQGSMVTETYSIFVPVTVTYGWGILGPHYVEIKVNPMKN